MKTNKKTTEIIVLSVLFLLLIGAVVYTLTIGAKKPAGPTPSTSQTPTATPSATTASTPGTPGGAAPTDDLAWIDNSEHMDYSLLVREVVQGRDPFQNFLYAVDANGKAIDTPAPDPGKRGTGKSGSGKTGGSDVPGNAEGLGRLSGLGGVKPGDGPVKVETPPPPVPAFVLSGVITTATERFAAIAVDDQYYTLMEGDLVPKLGWRVKKITPEYNTVVLTKDTQSVTLRMSGGSSK